MRCVGWDNDHITGAAAPRLVSYGDVDFAGQDAQDFLAMMKMNWSAFTSGKLACGEDDAA